MSQTITADIIAQLGFEAEIARLNARLDDWRVGTSPEMRAMVDWQFVANPKYFRPLTIFSCWRSLSDEPIPDELIRSAAVLEMMHNVSLIIDDILDATADTATLGKTAGKDAKDGKTTYVKLHGLEASRRFANECTDRALAAIASLPGETGFLRTLATTMAKRGA